MSNVSRIEIEIDLNDESITPMVKRVFDKVGRGYPSPVLYLKDENAKINFTFFTFILWAMDTSRLKITGIHDNTIYENLTRGLYSAIQNSYSFEAKSEDNKEWVTKSIGIESLIDNDYLYGDIIITLSSGIVYFYNKSNSNLSLVDPIFEKVRGQATQHNSPMYSSSIRDLFKFENNPLHLTKLKIVYSLYLLEKVEVIDFTNRPGNFSSPIFNLDNSLQEYRIFNSLDFEHVVQSFSLHSASLFAASFDLKFNFQNNNQQITAHPKGSLFFKVYGAFKEPYELAYTPNLFVLRSRFIRRGLRLFDVKYSQWHITFQLVNITNESVDLFDDDNLDKQDYRIFSFVVPSQPRMLMYERFGKQLLDMDSNFTHKKYWTYDLVKKFDVKFNQDVQFKSRMENILKEVFGVPSTIARVYRKEKPSDGSKRKFIDFNQDCFNEKLYPAFNK